jgi:transposase
LRRVLTLSDVAKLTCLSWATVKAITKTHLIKDYGKPALRDVRYLGIDEIHLGQKKRFYTIGIDLQDGRILWAKPGRGKAALRGFWPRLRRARAQIQAVAIDMSGAYWSAVLEHWPEAALVFDKFHILKLMNERLDDLRRERVREAEGPLKLKIKGPRFLLLRNPKNLTTAQIPKLEPALHRNEPLLLAWYLKEELRELWNQASRPQLKAFLEDWGAKAGQTGIGQLLKMAKTLRTHTKGILAYADHPITSARLEGITNKIKPLTKRSYGFHDENFFILKLLSLHHSKYKLLG